MTSAVDSTTSSQAATNDPLAAATSSTGALGQDAFMKLLVAQMQNQDPLNPASNTEFVSQLAQFSSLEQQTGTNKLLELLSIQQKGLANSADVDLVGKSVTVAGNTLTSDGQGYAIPGNFTLQGPAADVKVSISDSTGSVIRTIDLGAHAQGGMPYTWDGRNDTGTVQPAGNYTVNVSAKDANGNPIAVNQQTTGVVTAVSFDQNGASLTLADGTVAATSNLSSVAAAPAATK
jgi:flagellar basal-body rod modification protein FlgD